MKLNKLNCFKFKYFLKNSILWAHKFNLWMISKIVNHVHLTLLEHDKNYSSTFCKADYIILKRR